MNTPSHWLIGASVHRRLHGGLPMDRGAFLWGAVGPDLPLYLLTVLGWIHLHLLRGWPTAVAFRYMFDVQFFRDPLWVISHNLLHSPLALVLLLLLLGRYRRSHPRGFSWGFWFLMGCLLHTALDIPVHVEDGPLLFFPLDWSTRFRSLISYWDPRYFGAQFLVFELSLDGLLMVYLWANPLRRWIRHRFRRQQLEWD